MKEFDDLLHAAGKGWPALHDCLAAGGASEAELRDVEQHLCCTLPSDVRDFYRRTKLKGAQDVEPLFNIYIFYPFDWFKEIGQDVLNLWRTEDAFLLPLMTDGCGVEICWEIRPQMRGVPRILFVEYGDVSPYCDSIRAFLCTLRQGIDSGVFPMTIDDEYGPARKIFADNNPASRARWED